MTSRQKLKLEVGEGRQRFHAKMQGQDMRKIDLTIQGWDDKEKHTIVTATNHISCTAGYTAVCGGQRIRTAQFRFRSFLVN